MEEVKQDRYMNGGTSVEGGERASGIWMWIFGYAWCECLVEVEALSYGSYPMPFPCSSFPLANYVMAT